MKLLLLMIKNTAVLDFVTPLFWKAKEKNLSLDIKILYCGLSHKQILRKSKFYTQEFNKQGVKQYDYASFLKFPFSLLSSFVRRIYANSRFDRVEWVSDLNRILPPLKIGFILINFLNKLKGSFLSRVNYKWLFKFFDPDLILMDHTIIRNFPGAEYVFEYFEKEKKKIILLPHAPHHSSTKAFTPFSKDKDLVDYCEYWMPFKFDKTWKVAPKKKKQFQYSGYPGLDLDWLKYIKAGRKSINKPLKCLLIVRKFLGPGVKLQKRQEYIYNYKEFTKLLEQISRVINQNQIEVELIIKPHPSNDFNELNQVLSESNLKNWQISYEPVYSLVNKIDMVISLYSTTLLIPAMAGIPVILLHSSKQTFSHKDKVMKKLYTNLSFYARDKRNLLKVYNEVVNSISTNRKELSSKIENDIKHLRLFFPKKAAERCLKRLKP